MLVSRGALSGRKTAHTFPESALGGNTWIAVAGASHPPGVHRKFRKQRP